MSLLRHIYNLWPKQFNQLAFDNLPKDDEFGKMEFAFVCEGVRYYRYIDALDIPLARKGAIDEILVELSMKTQTAELDVFLDAIEKTIDQAKGGKVDTNRIIRIVGELRDRKEILVHVDIWFALVAATHYAEGERPWEWNAAYEAKKIQRIKAEYERGGALYDFFVQAALKRFIPYIELLKENWSPALAISNEIRSKQESFLSLLTSQSR